MRRMIVSEGAELGPSRAVGGGGGIPPPKLAILPPPNICKR